MKELWRPQYQPSAGRAPNHVVRLHSPANTAAEIRNAAPVLPGLLPDRPRVGHTALLQLVDAETPSIQQGVRDCHALESDLDHWRILWGRVTGWRRAAQVGELTDDLLGAPRERHAQLVRTGFVSWPRKFTLCTVHESIAAVDRSAIARVVDPVAHAEATRQRRRRRAAQAVDQAVDWFGAPREVNAQVDGLYLVCWPHDIALCTVHESVAAQQGFVGPRVVDPLAHAETTRQPTRQRGHCSVCASTELRSRGY